MTLALVDVVIGTRIVLIVLYCIVATMCIVYWFDSVDDESRGVLAGIAVASIVWATFYSGLIAAGFTGTDTLVTLIARVVHFPTLAVFASVAILTHRRDRIRKAVAGV